jgi:hypothetical protein
LMAGAVVERKTVRGLGRSSCSQAACIRCCCA